jgi:hypothetical protein
MVRVTEIEGPAGALPGKAFGMNTSAPQFANCVRLNTYEGRLDVFKPRHFKSPRCKRLRTHPAYLLSLAHLQKQGRVGVRGRAYAPLAFEASPPGDHNSQVSTFDYLPATPLFSAHAQ